MNSTDLAYKRDNLISAFIGECPKCKCTLQDYNEGLADYEMMLQQAISFGDKKEIKQLRKEIQHLKAEKRNFKRSESNKVRFAYS